MRVIECRAYGPPEDLVVAERETPTPGPGEVRVRVEAAGVNFVDALFVSGAYQVRIPPPFVPGNEIAGTVDALGEGVETLAVGERVMAQFGIGAFAEAVVVPADRLARIPDGVEASAAAAFQLTYATALYALRERGGLRAGETVLVLAAAGGVGSAAVDVAKALGARVIAAAAGADKLATARALGADATVDYETEDVKTRVRELTDGRGADVVVDPVGGPYSEPAVRATAWEGRFLVIGFAAGEIPRIPLNLALLRGCSIVGVDWGALSRERPAETRPVTETLAAWLGEGRIRPHVSRSWPLTEAGAALRAVLDRQVHGKAVLVPGD
jgi:NADPH2:quinone reductase